MDGRAPAPVEPSAYARLSAADLPAAAGTNRVAGVGRVTLEERGGRALVRSGNGIEYPGSLVEDDQLYVPRLDVWIGFPASSPARFGRLSWISISHVAEGLRAP